MPSSEERERDLVLYTTPLGETLGMLREAERQLKSSLMDQDMVVTYLELVKVVGGTGTLNGLRSAILVPRPRPNEYNTQKNMSSKYSFASLSSI